MDAPTRLWPRRLLAALLLAPLAGGRDVVDLRSGEERIVTDEPFTWTWYALNLSNWTDDGERVSNVVVSADPISTIVIAGEDNWASLDVVIYNGTLPDNAGTGDPGPFTNGNPVCWCDAEPNTRRAPAAHDT